MRIQETHRPAIQGPTGAKARIAVSDAKDPMVPHTSTVLSVPSKCTSVVAYASLSGPDSGVWWYRLGRRRCAAPGKGGEHSGVCPAYTPRNPHSGDPPIVHYSPVTHHAGKVVLGKADLCQLGFSVAKPGCVLSSSASPRSGMQSAQGQHTALIGWPYRVTDRETRFIRSECGITV
jgi:hypothetical protein